MSPIDVLRHVGWFMSAQRISWFVLFPLQLWFASQGRWVWFGVCAVLSALVLVFRGTIGNFRIGFRYRALIHAQQARDEEAEECLKALRAGRRPKRPVVLFLRPFSGDKSIKLRDPYSPDGYDVMTLESRLVSGFASWATTISFRGFLMGKDVWGDVYADMVNVTVDDPDFYKIEGRLFYTRPGEIKIANETWFDDFRLLAEKADLIVSVPIDASPAPEPSSTLLELLHLSEHDLLDRCVFVMPPDQEAWMLRPIDETEQRPGTSKTWGTTGLKISALWESTRTKLKSSGIALPPFTDSLADDVVLFTLRSGELKGIHVPRRELGYPKWYLKYLGITLRKGRAARA